MKFAPGTQYNYSNTNYMLLGMIVEAVTRDTIEHQIETRLLVPLGKATRSTGRRTRRARE